MKHAPRTTPSVPTDSPPPADPPRLRVRTGVRAGEPAVEYSYMPEELILP